MTTPTATGTITNITASGVLGEAVDWSTLYTNIWTPRQFALWASLPEDELALQEPNVIYEGGVWKLWYSQGYTSGNRHISYATSTDGLSFTRYASNPVVSGWTRAHVMKVGSTYYMYAIDVGGATGYGRLSSTDGITWAVDGTAIFGGTSGQWDADGIANTFVWVEDGIWYLLYESNQSGGIYKIGLATSPDGLAWTKYASNPVITNGAGSVSGPFVVKIGANYVCWAHVSPTGVLPTDITRYKSTDLHTWTRISPTGLTLPRVDADDGIGTAQGQSADVSTVTVNGVTYAYYTDTYNGGGAFAGIRVATANLPITIVSETNEGIATSYKRSYLFNGSFERAGTTFEKWLDNTGNGAIARVGAAGEFRPGTSGLYAVRVTGGASFNTSISQGMATADYPHNTPMVVQGWARGDGTNRGRVRVFAASDLVADWSSDTTRITNSTTWTYFEVPFTTPSSGNVVIYLYCPAVNGGVCYFDDLKLTVA